MTPGAIMITDGPQPGSALITLPERVTIDSARRLHEAARDLAGRRGDVVVGYDRVEYLDTSVVQLLESLGRELAAQGRRCDAVGVSGRLRELLRLAGLGAGPGG